VRLKKQNRSEGSARSGNGASDPQRPADLTVEPGGRRLGELLVDVNLVSRENVIAALTEAQRGPHKLLGQRLVERGLVNERNVAWVVARQYSLEFVDLRDLSPEPAAVKQMTEAVARRFIAVPLSVQNGELVIATAFPFPSTISRIQEAIGKPLAVKVASRADILRAINSNYRALTGVSSQVRAFQAANQHRGGEQSRPDTAVVNDDAPVVQIVHLLITQALRDRASDIHIEPQQDRIRIRYRIDGALHEVLDLPASIGPVVVSRIKILADMNIVERRRPQDGQISMDVEGRSVDIRVSTTGVIEGEKVVMRLLDKSRPLFRLGQLGMPDNMIALYTSLLRAPAGMVICAGPTGSGKTTTLYGSLSEINSPERNVMTIEDPVEYRIPTINQIQIHEQAGITFAGGLRSILRQDPDVILGGEIRDVETARIAVQAALTGHFVLSSLHANDAASALHRLLDMGIEGFLVASSVAAVVSQRLMRRTCNHCRVPYQPKAEELAMLQTLGGRPPPGGFARGQGCNFCAHTGFLERIGVYEMMLVTEVVRDMILRRAAHDEIRTAARKEGMRTLQEEAARLIESGVTTLSEVLRTIHVVGG
jgi:type IV pilus assembly protein PilB